MVSRAVSGSAGGANVVEFGQKKADLEEVFLSMVEGDRVHGR
jgi:hypothetical protein